VNTDLVHKLTTTIIAEAAPPQTMLGDGAGLWLFVNPLRTGATSKRFAFRYRLKGRYHEIPIGAWPKVSLDDARGRAAEFRDMIARGLSPATEQGRPRKPKLSDEGLTFKDAALAYLETKRKGHWRNLNTAEEFERSFRLHIFPAIGDTPIADIGDNEARAVLKPIFARSPDLGRRLVARAKAVYDRAHAMRQTDQHNPFIWDGYLEHVFPAPPPAIHRPAIPWADLPALYAQLTARGDLMPALAARFMIALALRPNEARTARFDMINWITHTLTLPMTKNGKPFVIPMNEAALAVVARVKELRLNDYLFPGIRPNQPIHNSAILELIQSMTGGATAHGVARSCYSDWAYENGRALESVIETSLNHIYGTEEARAYKRGNQLALRRKLGRRYSYFLLRGRAKYGSTNV
jgi:integrase